WRSCRRFAMPSRWPRRRSGTSRCCCRWRTGRRPLPPTPARVRIPVRAGHPAVATPRCRAPTMRRRLQAVTRAHRAEGGWSMDIGLIIVGDEILSGERQDKHLTRCIDILNARGLTLTWARYVGDDRARLSAALREAFGSGDLVFSCGGI